MSHTHDLFIHLWYFVSHLSILSCIDKSESIRDLSPLQVLMRVVLSILIVDLWEGELVTAG